MSKRKPIDKAEARERRNGLLASAAAAELSLTEGVREMRAIAGMTQEEFARHREVSVRVIKAIELGQGNPTVATLNRIGQFFGLEVGFVPVKRKAAAGEAAPPSQAPVEWPALPHANDSGAKSFDVWRKENYQELAHLIWMEVMQNSMDAVIVAKPTAESRAEADERLPRDQPAPAKSAGKKRTPRAG